VHYASLCSRLTPAIVTEISRIPHRASQPSWPFITVSHVYSGTTVENTGEPRSTVVEPATRRNWRSTIYDLQAREETEKRRGRTQKIPPAALVADAIARNTLSLSLSLSLSSTCASTRGRKYAILAWILILARSILPRVAFEEGRVKGGRKGGGRGQGVGGGDGTDGRTDGRTDGHQPRGGCARSGLSGLSLDTGNQTGSVRNLSARPQCAHGILSAAR